MDGCPSQALWFMLHSFTMVSAFTIIKSFIHFLKNLALNVNISSYVGHFPNLPYSACGHDGTVMDYVHARHIYIINTFAFPLVQFSLVAQSCLTLCDPMNCSTPGLPVHHQLLEFTQTHVHRVSDAIQSSHPLSSPSPTTPNPSQHQSLFQ